jgi:hypothetical protein
MANEKTLRAYEFIESIKSPIVFYIVFYYSLGIPRGYRVAVLGDDTGFPFDLSHVSGTISANGEFEWNGEGDLSDFSNNLIRSIKIYDDADEYGWQLEECIAGNRFNHGINSK